MGFLKQFLKLMAAGITAFAILCGISYFYYASPNHVESTLGNTDFVWPAHGRWMQMVEGISWGHFDDWGFNNPQRIENPDILVLGSSHMESIYVDQSELLSVRLQEQLGGRASVYNMGISGCHLPQTLQYLPKTLEVYENPPGLILIEAHDLHFTEETAAEILEGRVHSIFEPKPRWQRDIMGLPYLRLLAKQKNMGLMELLNPPRKPAAPEPWELPGEPLPEDAPGNEAYDPVFSYLRDLQEKYGVQILIFYQPTEELQEDGSVLFPQDPWVNVFGGKCRDYGIGFLNVTETFEAMYEKDHLLPHGFVTGRIGTGHLNRYGHQAVAEAVAGWIAEKEGN